jgi:uncharacterized membrane protein
VEIKSLFGLPAHPLLVHVPIVLIPLVAIGAVLMLWPSLRAKIGWATVILAGVATVFSFLAVGSGEALEGAAESTANEKLLDAHTSMGENIRVWIALLFLVLLAIMLWDRYRARLASGADANPRVSPSRAKAIGTVLSVLSIVFASVATYWIVRIGHSGAKASWNKTEQQLQRGGGGEGGGESDGDG